MRLIVILLFISIGMSGQSNERSEFTWDKETNICTSSRTGNVVYLVPKYPPVITQMSKKSFAKNLKSTIDDMQFDKSASGTLLLHVHFEKPFPLTLDRVGTKGIAINSEQRKKLTDFIELVKRYNSGSTIGVEQNTVGSIRIDIINGQLSKLKYGSINFLN